MPQETCSPINSKPVPQPNPNATKQVSPGAKSNPGNPKYQGNRADSTTSLKTFSETRR
jgi:hypothetical protein